MKAVFPSLLAFASDYADMPKAPVISYSAPSPMGHFRTLPHAISGAYWCRRPTAVRRMESRFSSRYRESLRPSQTCKCTREYLFRTLHKKGRFSSRYRILPQTHADVLKHLWLPIPPSPRGTWHRRTGRWNSFQSNCRAR